MKTPVDIHTWARRPHYEFFKTFDDPFFSLTAEVDCRAMLQRSEQRGSSVFLEYLHASLRAANAIDEFCYRMEGDGVVRYHRVNASTTMARNDGTFGFVDIPYDPDFSAFAAGAATLMEAAKTAVDLRPDEHINDVIHYTSVPWLHFTGITHPRRFRTGDSIPKISFGKFTSDGHRTPMPVSVLVHHSLVDARHVAGFFKTFQTLLDKG